MLEKLEIEREFDFSELCQRLDRVQLRGFPGVCVYAGANKEIRRLKAEVREVLDTPQPIVHQSFIDRINRMAQLFLEKGIDIFSLKGGVDYTAFDETGQATRWTIIPPVIECFKLFFDRGGIDYDLAIGEQLRSFMVEKGFSLNPQLRDPRLSLGRSHGYNDINIINDGSHRVHAAYLAGKSQNLLFASQLNPGFPYYAAPQRYSEVMVLPERPPEGAKGKIHILTDPGHKALYRVFPTGGIHSGDVRPEKK